MREALQQNGEMDMFAWDKCLIVLRDAQGARILDWGWLSFSSCHTQLPAFSWA